MENAITTREQLEELVEYYLKQDAFAFDVETVGDRRLDTTINTVLWITLRTYGRTDVIPMGHPNGELLEVIYPLTGQGQKRVDAGYDAREYDYSRDDRKATKVYSDPPKQLFPQEVFEALRPLMFSPTILKIGHNLIFDLTSIAKYYKNEVPCSPYFDTMIAASILDNRHKKQYSLDACVKRELGYEMAKGVGKEIEKHPFYDAYKYSFIDGAYTFLLWKTYAPRLEADKLTTVMALEMAVLRVLCDMKLEGALIDEAALVTLNDDLTKELEGIKAEIYKAAGRVFNINSNVEKQEILYSPKAEGGRGLKPKVYTPKGEIKFRNGEEVPLKEYSVSAEALEAYKGTDPLIDALLKYADVNKLLSTYVIPYLGGEVIRTTAGKAKLEVRESLLIKGKVHGDFKQHGAETGRFSSSNPNLQNIPAPDDKLSEELDHGKKIRNLFIAPKGYKLIVADYSQIEPRVLTHYSKDPILTNNYLTGGDIYTTIGDTMGVSRQAGKVLVLAMMYGVGPDKISKSIGCKLKEAKDLLDRFVEEFPAIARYKSKVIKEAKLLPTPAVRTLSGRIRYIPDLNSTENGLRAAAERQAFNTKIQGTAADLIKIAMVRAYERLPEGSKMILTVHDEIVTLSPDSLVDASVEAIKDAMENAVDWEIPTVAGIKVVQRWGEAK